MSAIGPGDVDRKTRVQARYATGGHHCHGRVVAYSEGPQVLIVTDSGEKVWWRADLCTRVDPETPSDGGASAVEDEPTPADPYLVIAWHENDGGTPSVLYLHDDGKLTGGPETDGVEFNWRDRGWYTAEPPRRPGPRPEPSTTPSGEATPPADDPEVQGTQPGVEPTPLPPADGATRVLAWRPDCDQPIAFWQMPDGRLSGRRDGENDARTMGWVADERMTLPDRPAPPEPPVGSVVVDYVGQAWQRDTALWYRTGSLASRSWADLHEHHGYGALTVVYSTEDTDS